METILIESDKPTANLLKQMLKEFKGVTKVKHLSKEDKEDLAITKAILEGETGIYLDTDKFLKKLKAK